MAFIVIPTEVEGSMVDRSIIDPSITVGVTGVS